MFKRRASPEQPVTRDYIDEDRGVVVTVEISQRGDAERCGCQGPVFRKLGETSLQTHIMPPLSTEEQSC